MPKFHYARFGKSWGVESVVDESTYTASRDMFAESLGLPPASLEYLVQYGVNQTTQDSMAQPTAAAKQSGDDVKVAGIAAADKRWDAIRAGTVGVRVGTPRIVFGLDTPELDVAARDYVDECLSRAAKKSGKSLPKGEDYGKLRLAYFNAKKAEVIAEATRRVESVSDVDLDALTA